MFEFFIQISKDSWGLIPLMIIILTIGIAVSIERLFFYHNNVSAGWNLEHDLELIDKGDIDKAKILATHYEGTVQGRLVASAIPFAGTSVNEFERSIDERVMIQLPKMDRNLWVLDTCVTLGPLMGLLGTIIHMIEAFSVLSTKSAQGVHSVTGPIAHALIATAVGLCIAIICVVFLNYFNKRVRLLLLQLDLIKSMLVSRLALQAQ